MAGFDVTPRSPSSATSLARPPERRKPRATKSSHTAWPCSCSSISGLAALCLGRPLSVSSRASSRFMGLLLVIQKSSLRAGPSAARLALRLGKLRPRSLHHLLCREAELHQEVLERRGGAEAAHADDRSAAPGVTVPADDGTLLDGDARGDFRRQHGLAITLVLPLEQFPRRHAHHAGAHTLALERLVDLDAQPNLAAGADEDDVGLPAFRVG